MPINILRDILKWPWCWSLIAYFVRSRCVYIACTRSWYSSWLSLDSLRQSWEKQTTFLNIHVNNSIFTEDCQRYKQLIRQRIIICTKFYRKCEFAHDYRSQFTFIILSCKMLTYLTSIQYIMYPLSVNVERSPYKPWKITMFTKIECIEGSTVVYKIIQIRCSCLAKFCRITTFFAR